MDLKLGEIYNVQLGCAEPIKGIYLGKKYSPKSERNWRFLFKDSKGFPEIYTFDLDKTVFREGVFVIHYPSKKKIQLLERNLYETSSNNSIIQKFKTL